MIVVCIDISYELFYFFFPSQNKILHSRLEALHIKLAEKDCHSSGFSGSCPESSFDGDDGLQKVVKYLRRSKDIVCSLNL